MPLWLCFISEDVDTFHEGADKEENFFGKVSLSLECKEGKKKFCATKRNNAIEDAKDETKNAQKIPTARQCNLQDIAAGITPAHFHPWKNKTCEYF